jgi:hypothetical protein
MNKLNYIPLRTEYSASDVKKEYTGYLSINTISPVKLIIVSIPSKA